MCRGEPVCSPYVKYKNINSMIIFESTDTTVKALWGKSVLKDVQVHGCVVRQLQSATPEDLSNAITSIMDEKTMRKYRPLILCVPRNKATLRNLKFPAKDGKELDDIINLHLTQEVPYSREEILHNYAVLGRDKSGFTNILLGIMHRRALIKQFSVFEKMNMYPDNVLLSTYGLLNYYKKARPVKTGDNRMRLCLDIDSEFTDFFVFKGNNILFSKSIAIEGDKLTDGDKLQKFIGELKQAMIVFQAGKQGAFSGIYISGARVRRELLEKNIAGMFRIPVEVIDPMLVNPSLPEVKDVRQVLVKASFTAMLGITMDPMSAKFAFVLPEAKLRNDLTDLTRNLFAFGGVVLYVLVLFLLGFMSRIYAQQAYVARLETEIKVLEHKNKGSLESLDKIKLSRKFCNYRDSFLFYYYELTKIMPDNITINRILFTGGKEFSLVGSGSDMGDIFKFVKSLNDAKIFGNVKLRYSRKASEGSSRYNEFDIMCNI